MSGHKEFWLRTLHPDFISCLLPAGKKEMNAHAKAFRKNLLGITTEPIRKASSLTEIQKFTGDIFRFYTEILDCLKGIDHSILFIKRKPPAKKFLPQHEYLRYHVTHYLEELYILEERMVAQLKYLQKKLQKKRAAQKEIHSIDAAIQIWRGFFKDLRSTRGRHVHEYRFSAADLDHLRTLDLAMESIGSDDVGFAELTQQYYDMSYGDYRKIRLKAMLQTIKSVENTVDQYYSVIIAPAYQKIKIKMKQQAKT